MLFEDTYRTIAKASEGDFRDRGSKFLAFAYTVGLETELKDNLIQLKSLHPKANHHCWALRLTIDRTVFRISDDGEPAGTTGSPMLNTLLSRDLTNIALVVVRYFGGTLLGVPGLINAYKCATEDVLKNALIVEKTVNDVYTVEFGYPQINDVMRIIKEESLHIMSQKLDNKCNIQLSVRKMPANKILLKLDKLTGIQIKYNFTIQT